MVKNFKPVAAVTCPSSASGSTNKTSTRINSKLLFIVAAVGLCVSIYGYYVEMKKEMDDSYSALCDLNPMYSCTKILNSEYGRLLRFFQIVEINSVFDVPNTVGGMIFYIVMMFGSFFTNSRDDHITDGIRMVLLFAATISVMLSAYLAWVMAYKLAGIICIVCLLSYVCNISLFLLMVVPMLRSCNFGTAGITNTTVDMSKDKKA